jgi:hypothetical protein
MILSEQKPFEEILAFLGNDKSVFVIGCNGCAYSSGSGGPPQVAEMKKKLEEAGKKVTGTKSAAFLCEKALVKSELRGKVNEVAAADSVLVLTCGLGIQAVASSINKVCHPGCNTINRGGSRGEWEGSERCFECGQCLLDFTGGICPLTSCTKSLISGACGGANKGMCEVSPYRPCGWEQIYERLKAKGQLEKLQHVIAPLDNRKLKVDPKMMATPLFGLENKPPVPKPAAPNAEVKTK